VAANSATLVASIGLSRSLHPDFGAALYAGSAIGIPFQAVSGTQPTVNVVIDAYSSESDQLPIPIPANAAIEGDPLPSDQNTGDRHLLVYDQDHNVVYETYNTHRPSETPDHQWHADSEAVWDLGRNSFRTPDFTSADAAGLPILPGLIRPDEVLDQGRIDHAIRFTVPRSRNAYVFPASHQAGVNNPSLPRMGERFRLKQSFDISGYSHTNQVILQALKDYGMIVADNGSGWYLSGQPSSRWDDNDLHNLSRVLGSDFEAVDLTPAVSGLSASSGLTAGGTSLTITGLNFSGGAGQTQVFFGDVPAASVTVMSDIQIVVVAPAHAAGTVDVTVHSPYGTSEVVAGDQFTYSDQPQDSTLHQRFVAAIYRDLLQRQADAGGLAYWTGLLDQGSSPNQIVLGIESSTEYRTLTVMGLYQQLLHRAPDPSGQSYFLNQLAAGATVEQVQAEIAGSPEYFQARGGGSNGGFLAALYQDSLQRAPDPTGQVAFGQALDNGVSPGAVAAAVFGSDEYQQDLIQAVYGRFLHRTADATGLALFTSAMKHGARDEDILAAVVGSPEYLGQV
jgi:hypothetical protein